MNEYIWTYVGNDFISVFHKKSLDPKIVRNRIAVITKSPRVLVPEYMATIENDLDGETGVTICDHRIWIYGGKGDGPLDKESKQWCEELVKILYCL